MTTQNKNLRIVFISAICFVFILSFFSYSKITSLVESAALVNHTTQVTLDLEKVIRILKDAETAHRGYLLTHDQKFLESFNKGLKEFPPNIKSVEQLTIDNPEQQKSLAAIELLAKHREDYMRKMLEIDKLRTPTAAELLIGNSIMDSVRTEINTMIARENTLMELRTNELHKQIMIAPAMLLILSLMALAILIISYLQLNKSLLQAQQLKSENLKFIVEAEKQKELQNIFKQAPVAISIYRGNDYIVESINDIGLELWGKNRDEVINKAYLEISPELRNVNEPIFKNIVETGQGVISKELKIEFIRNGKPYTGYFTFLRQPLRNINGIIDGVISIAIEVTESVNARKAIEESEERFRELSISLEEKVKERTKELEQINLTLEMLNKELHLQKEFSDTILNTTPDLIEAYDSEMRIIAFNKACEDLFHIKKEDVIGKKYVDAFPEARNSQGHQDLVRALNGETIHNSIYQSVNTGRHYENFIIPLINALGKVYAAVAITHDATDIIISAEIIKKANEELQETITELKKANKELESFNYISSHDLQEPLRQIQNFASRIVSYEHQNLSEKGKIYFEKMNNAANRMQTLIADLLAYSRANTAERKFEIADLNKIVNDVIKEFKETIEEKQATIEVAELGDANVIPFQFRQMMYNLIGNSLKFSKHETPSHIIIKNKNVMGSKVPGLNLNSEKEYCHISVSDNGIGFEPQYKDRIFEVFQRLQNNQKIAGTGIGLAIVKKIVEIHHGVVTATGEPNNGATFDIYIPTN